MRHIEFKLGVTFLNKPMRPWFHAYRRNNSVGIRLRRLTVWIAYQMEVE